MLADERLTDKISPEPNSGCWIWVGARFIHGGYGMVRRRPKAMKAHRYIWELLNGPVPAGLELDHRCRQPACVNPNHLEPVTHRENMRRGKAATKIHCKRGHVLNYYAPSKRRRCFTCERLYYPSPPKSAAYYRDYRLRKKAAQLSAGAS